MLFATAACDGFLPRTVDIRQIGAGALAIGVAQ